MANEAQVRSSLQILKQDGTIILIEFQGKPTVFNADVTGTKGPSPGSMSASVEGTDVDFSELTTPGLCRISNQDATNFVTVGIWDPEGNKFYPIDEILPGESYIRRLSRDLQEEFGTGTGTTGAETNRLRLKADTAAVNVLVEAFET